MISIIFAVMNREDNFMASLLSWIDVDKISEYIVVDWSSSKPLIENVKLKELMKSKNIKIIRVDNEQFFSVSKACNLGIKLSSNKIILKCDADYFNVNPKWMNHLLINESKELNNYYIIGDYFFSKSLTGFLLVNKKHFVEYNENFEGWGYEDIDLYNRISKTHKNLKKIIFFDIKEYVYHIPHSEESRTENYKIKNKSISLKNNQSKTKCTTTFTKYNINYINDNYIIATIKK